MGLLIVSSARAIEIVGVQPFAFDQPQVYALLQPAAGGAPYSADIGFGIKTFNIFGFLDTGSSGVVISTSTSESLNVPATPGVVFKDVAIGGTTDFNVSQQVNVRVAPSNAVDVDNLATYPTVYNQATSNVRLQLGPTNVPNDPLGEPLDVFGMPVMMGKTVVMDPKPLHQQDPGFPFPLPMQTYIYEQGTPFNPATADTNPGIPQTSHQVQLSYGDFGRFTQTIPGSAQGPSINHNPFIGPNPLLTLDPNPPVDNTPPVSISFQGHNANGSFLLDTGAVASFISTDLAAQLNVRYAEGTFGTGAPVLEIFDPAHPELPGTAIANQFALPIGGLGGSGVTAGFFLDSLTLQTLQGGPVLTDPDNMHYVGAPVLVNNIELEDPITGDTLTLDGIFGMNFLVASAMLSADLSIGDTAFGPYGWVTYDEPHGLLGLDLITIPEPSSLALAALAGVSLVAYRFRRRTARRAQGVRSPTS